MTLSEYTVVRRGVELTMMLTEEDAKAVGAVPVAKGAAVENKATKAVNRAARASDK